MKFNYGIMQGRLSKIIGNKIQAFPEKILEIWIFKSKKARIKINRVDTRLQKFKK